MGTTCGLNKVVGIGVRSRATARARGHSQSPLILKMQELITADERTSLLPPAFGSPYFGPVGCFLEGHG